MELQIVGVEYHVSLTKKQFEKLNAHEFDVESWFVEVDEIDRIGWSGHFGAGFWFRIRKELPKANIEAEKVIDILKRKLK